MEKYSEKQDRKDDSFKKIPFIYWMTFVQGTQRRKKL